MQVVAVLVVQAALAEILAVVGGEHRERVVEAPEPFQAFEQAADLGVGIGDLGVVELAAVVDRLIRWAAVR